MIYVEEPHVTISYDEQLGCIICQWRGFDRGEKVKASLKQVLELLEQNKLSKWITDLSKIAPFSQELENWIQQEWFPQAIKAGLKTVGFVIPKSNLARLGLDNALKKSPLVGVELALFDTQEAARKWLSSL